MNVVVSVWGLVFVFECLFLNVCLWVFVYLVFIDWVDRWIGKAKRAVVEREGNGNGEAVREREMVRFDAG